MAFQRIESGVSEKLAAFVREVLQRKGWSARRLAEEIGVAPATVTNIANGTTSEPTLSVLKKLAKVAKIPLYKVLMLVDPELEIELTKLIAGLTSAHPDIDPELIEMAARLKRIARLSPGADEGLLDKVDPKK